MPHPKKDFLTIEQIAERWGLNTLEVHQLMLTRRLPQTFLVSGSAILVQRAVSHAPARHALTANTSAPTRVLVSTLGKVANLRSWPLGSINRVYDFVIEARSEPLLLEQLCLSELSQPAGWTLEFDADGTEVIGQDRFRQAAEVLQGSAIVLTDALLAFEEHLEISPKMEHRAPTSRQQDARKQRCRAVAQILWERDPSATLPDIFESEWVQRIACENRPPSEKTFREWVKDLNPDRSPGRRPN